MHRGGHIVRRDVKVSETIVRLIDDISKSLRIDLKDSDKKIGSAWQDVSIFSDPGEPALGLELHEQLPKLPALGDRDVQTLGQISLCQRLILR